MFRLQHLLKLTLATAVLAAFACSNTQPDDKSQAHAGAAGGGAASAADAGASEGGEVERAGSTSHEAGADSAAGDGGSNSVDESESQGGESDAQGGADEGGASNALGGSSGGSSTGGSSTGGSSTGGAADGELFVIGAPSADCQAAPAIDVSVPQAPGLNDAPSSGHPCDSTFEPNDADGQACQLTLGTPVQTQLSSPNDPVDKFVFHAVANVEYSLLISAVKCTGVSSLDAVYATVTSLGSTGSTTQLNATTYFGQQTAFSIQPTSATADELITFRADNSCEYDFKVVQSTAQGLAHDADYEPNDTPSTAQPIELNHRVSSRLSNPNDARDYFTLPTQANLTYSIWVSTQGCSGVTSLDSVTVQGQSLASGDPVANLGITAYLGGVFHAEFSTRASGQELLLFSTSRSCEYEFYVIPSTICGLGHDKTSYEPNDTPSTAAPISLNQTVSAELQTGDSTDYYSFAVDPNSQYTLTLSAASCHGSTSLASLNAELWSGRTEDVLKGSNVFYFGHSNDTFAFTSGSSTQQLLEISGGESCGYVLSISKG